MARAAEVAANAVKINLQGKHLEVSSGRLLPVSLHLTGDAGACKVGRDGSTARASSLGARDR